MIRQLLLRTARALASRRSLGLSVLAVLLLVRVWDPSAVEELRLKSFDLYQTVKPRQSPIRPVVIVDIDEASLNAYGQWPWPRTLIADLLTRLKDMGSAAIAFDVIFPEPDRSSPSESVKNFRGLDDATRERLVRLPSNDDIFATVIGQGRVVLGQSGTAAPSVPSPEALPETGFAVLGPDAVPYLVAFPHLLRNLPQLERVAAGRGLFSIRTERDGMVRRIPIVMQADGKIVPSLTLEMLRVVTGSGSILIRTDAAGIRSVAVPGLVLPTDQNGRIWIHFSPHDDARYVSAKDVIDGKVGVDRIAGKLVLIGTSAIGLLDVKTTPIDPVMPGVEVHAQLLEATLTDSLLTSPSYGIAVEMGGILIAGIALSLLAPLASALTLFGSAVAAAALFAAASWVLFSQYRTLFDASYALVAILVIYVCLVVVGYFQEQIARQRIRSAFGQYLSPTLVERLAQSPEQLVLGGEDRVLTILFSDVRGFTTISESYKDDPHGLTALMNRLLTPLTNSIINRNGTIDKYMGDAVMAFWNAPLDDAAHASHACEAALDMIDRIGSLNAEREKEASETGRAFLPIKIGIGLNTGRCVVGNMGSDLRFQYTVLGDSVNLASRLEGQTKNYGVPILVGSQTARAAGEFALIEVDAIRVKGKTEPEVVFAVLGRPDVATTGEFQKAQALVSEILSSYRRQQWDLALQAIASCRTVAASFELDDLLDLYSERIREFQLNPPPPDWNGVFVYETK